MKRIELIVTCYAGKYPQYAAMFMSQVASLLTHPPKTCSVCLTVCHSACDEMVHDVIDEAELGMDGDRLDLCRWVFPLNELFRRGLCRNYAAKKSTADIVWFADADALWLDGCLDALASSEWERLARPAEAHFHKTHAQGDADIERNMKWWKTVKDWSSSRSATKWDEAIPDPSRFQPERIKFASGGYIIVDGDTARKGFLDGTKWTQPVDPAGGFRDPREDIAYRKQFKKSTPLNLPNLYRFRHSVSTFQKAEDRLAQTAKKS